MIQAMFGRMKTAVTLPRTTQALVNAYSQEQDEPASALLGDMATYEAQDVLPREKAKISIDPVSGFPFLDVDFGHTFTIEEIADIIAEGE